MHKYSDATVNLQRRTSAHLRIGFVLHSMGVAGAEMLVAEIIEAIRATTTVTIFCLDDVGVLGEQLSEKGIEVVCLKRRPGFDRYLPGALAEEFNRRRIDMAHAHQNTPFFYSAAARFVGAANTKLVYTEHGRHFPDVVSRKRRAANRWLLARRADAVNACCRFSAHALAVNDGFPRDRIEVIRNGIAVERYTPVSDKATSRVEAGLDPRRRYVGIVARLHPVKDHATLLRAFSRIAAELQDVDLLLVGDGPLLKDLQQQVVALGLQSRIHFLGIRRDIPRLLQALDAFVLSSHSEAASLTLLEAMATGVPVVATRVGGTPEIITAGVHGALFPRCDDRSLAMELRNLLVDPKKAAELGRNARTRVLADYQLIDTVEAHVAVYERVLGRPLAR